MGFLEELIEFLRDLGAPGLMGLAFVDSAGIPTGGGPDWVLLVMVSESQLRMDLLLFVPVAVLGSSLGCLAPYHLGRRYGHLLLVRFEVERQASVRDKIDRYGLWAVALFGGGATSLPDEALYSLGRCVRNAFEQVRIGGGHRPNAALFHGWLSGGVLW